MSANLKRPLTKIVSFFNQKKKKKKIHRFCLFISKTQSIFDRAVYESSFENVFKSKYKKNLGRERREREKWIGEMGAIVFVVVVVTEWQPSWEGGLTICTSLSSIILDEA
jgi:hypothetical protein